jgi:carbamoyltransferase
LLTTVKPELRTIPLPEGELLKGFDLLKVKRSAIPAVTHVDYTARIQTVNHENTPDFYKLIKAFYGLTGCPCLVNTSFNQMDEPIVNTPQDAIDCFVKTGIDVLVIENFMVIK